MNIAILGYDVEGSASYEYFAALDNGIHQIVIHDQNPDTDVPEGAKSVLGPKYLEDLDEYDLLVRTPGLHPNKILKGRKHLADKLTSGTNEFLAKSPTKNIIGVTGTKGKGTTSTLISKILETHGSRVFLGGNIGVPALSFLPQVGPDDWVVLELSSFQLIDCKYSPNVGVCLMVVPEHLNWHKDMDEYISAKQQLFAHQTVQDLAIYNAGSSYSMDIVRPSQGVKGWYKARQAEMLVGYEQEPGRGVWVEKDRIVAGGTDIAGVDELALRGTHNWENVCAAIAATWEVTEHDIEAIRSVITSFSGLPHRLELIRTAADVAYYDDSFGTTPETAIVAIGAFKEPKIVILGGSDKGAEYTDLAKAVVTGNVKTAIVIGETGPAIAAALQDAGFRGVVNCYDPVRTMPEIVDVARQLAAPGDVVLLSTGCASFDMFKNYKDRAEQFVAAVNAL